MKKKTLILLLPLFAIGCSNVEMESMKQVSKGKELRMSKSPVLLHACDSPSCDRENKTSDTILVWNGTGDYRVVAEDEYIVYYHITGEEVRAKTSDVLGMRVKQDTIFIDLLRPDIRIVNELFRVYDKEDNQGKFYVSDPGIVGGF